MDRSTEGKNLVAKAFPRDIVLVCIGGSVLAAILRAWYKGDWADLWLWSLAFTIGSLIGRLSAHNIRRLRARTAGDRL